ncbi:hypothetical protein Pmar_PMAR024663 [Perkinsus marinus ATCC 50983]|uniref:t-SNARE coiled-coil homology domain-containing protein n=1 Tax=Perkinsus marinus (strain ATCC 50983 / TXsc) TaxID=423536 RepID=C5M1A2_PERM5|nr:hypothetical protein Pmar_PMAR024663 [Perkinsus marinus ATCC 50983]EEQ97224.1 hypothetical protein Pmar_PMAR024663 [Perkinsus marinus ATCC 50983]|eukprot:XP_002764507.1 hypothetical protein Pmar_PMAR024663 [Perkinsus marinus ATCC 50983]
MAKLENSVAEVEEMMSALALLIDRQGGLLDNIEFNMVNTKYTAGGLGLLMMMLMMMMMMIVC